MEKLINVFRYEEKHKLIYGYYNNHCDVSSLHELVQQALFDQYMEKAGQIASDGLSLAATPGATVDDGIGFFSRVIGVVNDITKQPAIELYKRKAGPWIKAIKEETDINVKCHLMSSYISLIGEFIGINIQWCDQCAAVQAACVACGQIVKDDSEEFCMRCGAFIPQYVLSSKYIDSNDFDAKAQKIVDDPYNKFHERYLRYQGRSTNTIAKDDLEKLHTLFAKEYYVKTDEDHRDDNYQLLRTVLTKLKLGKYKDDINLIMHELWDYELPDFSHLDSLVEANWRIGYDVLQENKGENDTITLSYDDWRLFEELTDLGIPLHRENFQLSNNKQTQKRRGELWALRCAKLRGMKNSN